MSIVTLIRGGRTIDASPAAARELQRQGWVEVAGSGPAANVAPRPAAVIAKPKRGTKKA
ncbi:MAG: hypothetical protein WBA82_08025 [Castellaniella sp.]|uniref:hypothetical protein n=1 Tax=Castellaniella sp. TaxID=1955812 RepID=UPI003C792A0E